MQAVDESAVNVWQGLAAPWKAAFRQAWGSWGEGNYGVGAVLVDPQTGDIVSSGRNRVKVVGSPGDGAGISGNFVAHAEMNAMIALDRFKADGLHLYTTLEPCFMCAATAVIMHVDSVHFAACDDMFSGLDEVFAQHPYGRKRRVTRYGPLRPEVAGFARVIPLVQQLAMVTTGSWVMSTAHEQQPGIAELAEQLASSRELHGLFESGASVDRALAAMWDRLGSATA